MTTWETIAWTGATALGLIGSALASGLETGGYCVNRIRLRLRATPRAGNYGARLLRDELEHPERLLATLLIANNGFNYLAATGITVLLAGAGYGDAAIIAINAAVLTPLLLVFGESLPKELFRANADRLTYLFAPHLTVGRLVLTGFGVVPLVRLFADTVAGLIGGEGEAGLARSSRERVTALIKETAGHGVLSASQATLVDRAMAFRSTTAADEMVPWARVATVGESWDRARLLGLLERSHFSRFPIVDTRGRVVGVLRHTDPYVRPDAAPAALALEPARLEPTTPLRDAIQKVRASPGGVGIVEQAGKPVGLVTIKDLVEPLTGELLEW